MFTAPVHSLAKPSLAGIVPRRGTGGGEESEMDTHQFTGSSTIDHIDYDAGSGTLSVTFHDGGEYLYFAVPREIYDAFCDTSSPGAFLNLHIKGQFDFRFDPARRRFGPKA